MRIIGGDFKRRIIRFPKTKKTRPMMDRVKETVFNILGDTVRETTVLDLFAGSGSLGLEALSRGATTVYFIDSEASPCLIIKENLKALGIRTNRAKVLQLPIAQAIRRLHRAGFQFNLIFIDPPFNKGLIKKVLRLMERFDIVKPFGKIVYQRSPYEKFEKEATSFRLIQEKAIGQALIGFMIADQLNQPKAKDDEAKSTLPREF